MVRLVEIYNYRFVVDLIYLFVEFHLLLCFPSTYMTETEGDNMTFVPLLEGMETNKAFLGKKAPKSATTIIF